MSQTIAYLRTSTDKHDLGNQKLEILEWARKKDLKIDEFVEITIIHPRRRHHVPDARAVHWERSDAFMLKKRAYQNLNM